MCPHSEDTVNKMPRNSYGMYDACVYTVNQYLFHVNSELLHRLHEELCQSPPGLTITLSHPFRDVVALSELLPSLFQGELASEVSYERCKHKSITAEAFWDLSLEFPQRYTCTSYIPHASCTLHRYQSPSTAASPTSHRVLHINVCTINGKEMNADLLSL